MIDTKDLRIGNIVSGTQDAHKYPMPLIVKALMNDEIYYEYFGDESKEFTIDNHGETSHSSGDCFGIPLNTEVLFACGFELFPWGYVKKSEKDFGVRLKVHSFSYDVSGNLPVQLQYLHELQNLWHSLTKTELTYNPTNTKTKF